MPDEPSLSHVRAADWDAVYTTRGADGVSWYQAEPRMSLELIDALGVSRDAAVIDVGGGASHLTDCLADQGFSDLTVLDISASALEELQSRLGDSPVRRLHADVLEWQPDRRYDLWHDRAVFHFLVTEADRRRYLEALRQTLGPGGLVILATFAPDGPDVCSGLPVARYSAEDLSSILGDMFESLETRRELHTTPRKSVQPFTWIAGRVSGGATSAPVSANPRTTADPEPSP